MASDRGHKLPSFFSSVLGRPYQYTISGGSSECHRHIPPLVWTWATCWGCCSPLGARAQPGALKSPCTSVQIDLCRELTVSYRSYSQLQECSEAELHPISPDHTAASGWPTLQLCQTPEVCSFVRTHLQLCPLKSLVASGHLRVPEVNCEQKHFPTSLLWGVFTQQWQHCLFHIRSSDINLHNYTWHRDAHGVGETIQKHRATLNTNPG